jgi:energy-coupling factor transporter ATP-binding protein EcfA2
MTPEVRPVAITSVRFRNYKSLEDYSLSLGSFNVLVGPNNAGKSTILGAFRLLALGLRAARSRKPEMLRDPDGRRRAGYVVATAGSSVSLENVHTDLADEDTTVTFSLSNKNRLRLYFPADGGCLLFCDGPARIPTSPTEFRAAVPLTIAQVPVLGPVEHREALLKEETVQAALETHRASRHFRNFWYYQPDGFDAFAAMLNETWPAMEIQRPEVQFGAETSLAMFCREERMTREIYWAGFGFQVWCQLLTHVQRAADSTLLIIDEPEIYLHPDLQRQLIHVLRGVSADVLLATHSTEILNEVDPSDLLLIERRKSRATRLTGAGDLQSAIAALGSGHNVQLAQLARHRRVVFVEGGDFTLLRLFARKLGRRELANGNGVAVVPLEGFSGWERVKPVAWGFEQVLKTSISLSVVLDRDFRSEEELEWIKSQLVDSVEFVHIHDRKEIENYLLDSEALERAAARAAADRIRRGALGLTEQVDIVDLFERATEPYREEWRGQYQARRAEYLGRSRRDLATLNTETSRWFEARWRNMSDRVAVVHGKKTLSLINSSLQDSLGVTLTPGRIVEAMSVERLPSTLVSLIDKLDSFRGGRPPSSSREQPNGR